LLNNCSQTRFDFNPFIKNFTYKLHHRRHVFPKRWKYIQILRVDIDCKQVVEIGIAMVGVDLVRLEVCEYG
jgi:hypothetical protein